MEEVLAEWITGKPTNTYSNKNIEDGTENEPQARASYEFLTGQEAAQVGLVYKDDDRLVSCSPDGLMENRGLEIKCPIAKTQIHRLRNPRVPPEMMPQVQGSMWICELSEWDWYSYHDDLDEVLINVEPDEKYFKMLDQEIPLFLEKMLEARNQLCPG